MKLSEKGSRPWWLLILCLGLVLAACTTRRSGNDPVVDNPPPGDGGQDEPADDTTDEILVEPVGLRWRTRPDNQAELDVYQAISDELDVGRGDLALVYEPGEGEDASYQEVLKTELASGTAPDVFWLPGTAVADFAMGGLILDLRGMADMTAGHSDEEFYPGPMFHLTFNPETGNSGEALWGLPRDVSTLALYLNLDLLAESGAPDPRELAAADDWHWDSFVTVAESIDALGDDIFGYGQKTGWGPNGYWINAAGGGFFNEDRSACALDSAEALFGLEFESRLFNEFGVAVPYGEDSERPFLAGKVGMFQDGRWATPGIRANVDFNWDVVELPDGPGGPSNWLFWGAYVVNAQTAHPEAAWELVQALTTTETQAKVAELGASIPSRVSQDALDAFLTYAPPANNQAFLNSIARNPALEGPLWGGSWAEFDAITDLAMTAVLSGATPLEAYATTICAEANRAFSN